MSEIGAAVPGGGGEVGELIRAKDWSQTPRVGEVEREAVAALDVDRLDLPFAILYEQIEDEPRLVSATGLSGREQRRLAGGSRVGGNGSDAELRRRLDGAVRRREHSVMGEVPVLELATDADRPVADKALVLPVDDTGDGSATLAPACGLSRHRPLDDDLHRFCELIANAIGGAVADARALEEERARVESLAELDLAKTEFFSNFSHEFCTPLTLLPGPLEDAVSRPDPDPALVMAHRNALRLLKHVNTLPEFSGLQAERVKADPRPIDLGTFCGEFASMFRSAVEKAGLTLSLDCAPGPVVVIADADQLEQIVLNLLQCAQVHSRGRDHRPCARVRRPRCGRGGRQRNRDPRAGSRSAVRALPPRRGGVVALARGQRHRTRAGQGGGRAPGWNGRRGERSGLGQYVLGLAAAGHGSRARRRPRRVSTRAEAFLAEALRWSDGVEPVAGRDHRPCCGRRGAGARAALRRRRGQAYGS
jgi:signal transduction histidine kinase